MNDKIKFKIGEFSKLNYVTVKTLRHYEEIGLLIPNEVDQWSGYRYYDVSQLKKMSRIIYLKKLGFSLEQIREMFEDGCQTRVSTSNASDCLHKQTGSEPEFSFFTEKE